MIQLIFRFFNLYNVRKYGIDIYYVDFIINVEGKLYVKIFLILQLCFIYILSLSRRVLQEEE